MSIYFHRLFFIFQFLFSFSLFAGDNFNSINKHFAESSNTNSSILLIRLNTSEANKTIKNLDHLLEHMLFKGTYKYQEYTNFMSFLKQNDIFSNARTGTNFIDLYFRINNDILETSISRIFQQFSNPLLSPKQIQKELIPFREELVMNEKNVYPRMRKCFFNQSHGIKYDTNVELLNPNDISKEMHLFYRSIFKQENFTIFFWSSKKQEKIENLLEKAINKISFFESNNNKPTELPATLQVANCNELNSPHKHVFNLQVDLNKYYISQDIHLFFMSTLTKDDSGSFIEHLRKNTIFNKVLFLPYNGLLEISFSSDKEYSNEDIFRAKELFFEYLKAIVNKKLINEISKNELAQTIYPIKESYSYYGITQKLQQVSRKPFEGATLKERLENFSKYVLLKNDISFILLNFNDDFNPEFNEKTLSPFLNIEFIDSVVNPFIPSFNIQSENKNTFEFDELKDLKFISPSIAGQYVNQSNKTKLNSLILQLKGDGNYQGVDYLYPAIKDDFEQQYKGFLNTLADANIELIIKTNKSLNLRVTSYQVNFTYVLDEILNRLNKVVNKHIQSQQISAQMLLLGHISSKELSHSSQVVAKYFDIKLNQSSDENLKVNNSISRYNCGENCVSFPLSFLDQREAHVFGKILQNMSANHFFNEVRFNQANSYDANLVLFYSDGTPEIRLTLSNSKADMSEYINNYFINISKGIFFDQEKQFHNSKKNLIKKLNDKNEFSKIVKHYWKNLIERGIAIQGISVEKKEIQNFSFDNFRKNMDKLVQASKKTKLQYKKND